MFQEIIFNWEYDFNEINNNKINKNNLFTNLYMKKYIISLLTLITMFITNPNENEHKVQVKEYMISSQYFIKNLEEDYYTFGAILGETFLEIAVDSVVTRKNYQLLSLTKWGDQVIGIGAFGKVFIFKNPIID